MGPDQLAGVMEQVSRASALSQGRDVDEGELKAATAKFRDGVERDSQSYRTSSVGHDDGIIDPRDTREVLGMCLQVVKLPGVKGTDSFNSLARM
jgi:acetyl-CoA carboxylase carboxyltransferase component